MCLDVSALIIRSWCGRQTRGVPGAECSSLEGFFFFFSFSCSWLHRDLDGGEGKGRVTPGVAASPLFPLSPYCGQPSRAVRGAAVKEGSTIASPFFWDRGGIFPFFSPSPSLGGRRESAHGTRQRPFDLWGFRRAVLAWEFRSFFFSPSTLTAL